MDKKFTSQPKEGGDQIGKQQTRIPLIGGCANGIQRDYDENLPIYLHGCSTSGLPNWFEVDETSYHTEFDVYELRSLGSFKLYKYVNATDADVLYLLIQNYAFDPQQINFEFYLNEPT